VGEPVVAVNHTEPKTQPRVISSMERRAVQPAGVTADPDLHAPEVSTEAGWSWTRAGDLASETIAPYPADITGAVRITGAVTTPARPSPNPRAMLSSSVRKGCCFIDKRA